MNRIQNNNNNNNNNNNKIKDKKEKKNQRKGERASDRERGVGRVYFYFYFSFSLRFFLRSTKIEQQVFVRTEGKVNLRDESYAWTPKSWSFVKLHEVGNFPTCVISSLNAI